MDVFEDGSHTGTSCGGKSFVVIGNHKKRLSVRPALDLTLKATIVAGKTSKACPDCGSWRSRRFERSSPFTFEQCEAQRRISKDSRGNMIPYKDPRRSSRNKWWNFWPLYLLISPWPNSKFYYCWEVATCKKCRTSVTVENEPDTEPKCYYRQFGPLRLFLFFITDRVSQGFDWTKNLLSPNR